YRRLGAGLLGGSRAAAGARDGIRALSHAGGVERGHLHLRHRAGTRLRPDGSVRRPGKAHRVAAVSGVAEQANGPARVTTRVGPLAWRDGTAPTQLIMPCGSRMYLRAAPLSN